MLQPAAHIFLLTATDMTSISSSFQTSLVMEMVMEFKAYFPKCAKLRLSWMRLIKAQLQVKQTETCVHVDCWVLSGL